MPISLRDTQAVKKDPDETLLKRFIWPVFKVPILRLIVLFCYNINVDFDFVFDRLVR